MTLVGMVFEIVVEGERVGNITVPFDKKIEDFKSEEEYNKCLEREAIDYLLKHIDVEVITSEVEN